MPPSRNYRIFIHVAAVLVSIVCLAPFVWLFIASTAATPDLLTRPLHWIPQHPSLDRYRQIFTAGGENVFVSPPTSTCTAASPLEARTTLYGTRLVSSGTFAWLFNSSRSI